MPAPCNPCINKGNFGIRNLIDQNMRFFRAGLPAWLRIKNFEDNPAFADMGFKYVPSATGTVVATGTTDIPIDPPPPITLISMHTTAMAQMAGSELRAGAREATISHTWVLNQMFAPWFLNMCSNHKLDSSDPKLVFRGPLVIGIVTDNLLLQQVDITHEDVFGQPITWFVKANASELSTSVVPSR